MFSYHTNHNFSYMYADLDIQILVLLGAPFEHLGLVQHLLCHSQQSLDFVPSHHLVLHLALDLLYACSCHVGVAHCFNLLHSET